MAQLLLQPGNPVLFVERPFAGDLGCSLYAAIDDGRGPASIAYRPLQVGGQTLYQGAIPTAKTTRLGHATSPTAEIECAIPDAWAGETVWVQLRTCAQDYENETLFRPRRLVINDDGDDDTPVLGTATITALEKRDDGGLLVRFAYDQPRDGLVPELFVLTKATGSGSIMPGTATYVPGARDYEVTIDGLSDGVAYTFTLSAEVGAVTTPLVTDIAFTGDAAGPPAVTLTVEEW